MECMQLARKCTERDLAEFLEDNTGGRIVSCRMIADRANRHKGIAYAEFDSIESVPKALALTGQRLLGAPIIIVLAQAEKNRWVQQQRQAGRFLCYSPIDIHPLLQ